MRANERVQEVVGALHCRQQRRLLRQGFDGDLRVALTNRGRSKLLVCHNIERRLDALRGGDAEATHPPSRPKLDEYLVVRVATGQGRLHDYDLECLHREGKRDLGEPAAFLEALQVEVQSVHLALHDVAGIKHGMTSVDEVVIEGRHHQLLVRHNPTQDRAVESVVLVLGLGVGYCGQAIKGGLATEHLDVVGRHWGQRVALFTQAAWALRRARPLGQRAGD
mmetsp:Transcript_5939/g.21740  ORF Transcript_5939/g.21740 Transcript_5939/m.21740 type:complete len:222 (-) Transcript_5939:67-732(-)